MKRLHNIDGCFAYFLELASQNLDNKKNIRIDRLCAMAESINKRYEAKILYPFDVKEIWVEVREYYKAWLEVVKIVPKRQIDWKLGKITVDPCEWEMIQNCGSREPRPRATHSDLKPISLSVSGFFFLSLLSSLIFFVCFYLYLFRRVYVYVCLCLFVFVYVCVYVYVCLFLYLFL